MNKEQVLNILEAIQTNYHNFEVDEKKLNFWAFAMKKMDYELVSKKLMIHVVESKFPPSIAELSAYPPEKNNHLEEMESWKKEAAKVPESKKQEFREQMQNLIRAKTNE
ncbi:MAG TPA: replicative helicase loader/inhibitor [Pseudogracilibacillus sp.]|nr:replicative helicase loader/inhibitor [Pseudogracilibacillus sp.]